MTNLKFWNKVKTPPAEATKLIGAGRLKGKTDINPQWRIKVLTEEFGICGIGWYTETVRTWTEECSGGEKMAFVELNLYIKQDNEWSKPINGSGGSGLIKKESKGLYANDEAYKMAETDAISVCCKKLGIASDVYEGKFESKYSNTSTKPFKENNMPTREVEKVACKKCGEFGTPKQLSKKTAYGATHVLECNCGQKNWLKPEDIISKTESNGIPEITT